MSKAKKTIELQLFNTVKIEKLPSFSSDLKVGVFRVGEPRSNGKSVVKHNALTIKKNYADDCPIDEIINSYLSNCINEKLLGKLREQLKPKQVFLRIHVPVKSSKWCQDDVVECATLAKLSGLELDLDFWFT